jgi:hypothetical protein
MNFSTNQVMQMFVLDGTDTVKVTPINTPNGKDLRGYVIKVLNEAKEVIDTTDIIDAKNIIYTTLIEGQDDILYRKGLLVKPNLDINEGDPVAGQDYIITLNYRGFGEEDTYAKVVEARAVPGDDWKSLLRKLAKSLIINKDTECSPLYELYHFDGTPLTEDNLTSGMSGEGFYIVEPKPYWSLGRFPETLMNIDVQTAPIMVNNEKETAWLANYKFAPVSLEGVAPLVNSRRVADLEYFCKGERGTSNALVGWPDTPDYVAKVNPNSKNGYSILTVHYAFVGANASNQKSEKDIIFVAERGSDAVALLSNIKSALEGNALIEE